MTNEMLESIVQERGSVQFPSFTGERVYMREFRKADGLPFDLARWQPTVDAMLDGVESHGPIYLMIDQSPVIAGATQRRPGVHIDGYWRPEIQAHGGNPGRHRHNPDPAPPPPFRPHVHAAGGSEWKPEAILLAASVLGCKGYAGAYVGLPLDGGDCSHVSVAGLAEVSMLPGRVYAGNVTMLHESIPVSTDCLRTLVRLNVPGWSPLP